MRKLIWTNNVPMQNFLGERGFWPVEEDKFTNKVGYERSPEIMAAIDSFEIRQIFYSNRK